MCRTTAHRWLWFALAVTAVFLIWHPSAAWAADDDALWDAACAKVDAGDLAGAAELFDQLLQEYPESPKAPGAQLKLAYIKLKTSPDSTQEIIDAFSLVRSRYASSLEAGEALVRIGYLNSKTDANQAISDFGTFLASYPGHSLTAPVLESLGRLYLRNLELEKAEAAFDKVKTVPNVSAAIADEAALQSGFVKIMKFYASEDRSYLAAAIIVLSNLTSSSLAKVRARADLGIAEATLLLGKYVEAREKYASAAQTYADDPYFRGIALYGAAFSSQEAGRMDQAITDYAALLAAQPGATLAEKDAAWKAAALASISPSVQIRVQKEGSWERLPGIKIICQSVFNQGRCLYLLARYDKAIDVLAPLAQYLPAGTELHTRTLQLMERCRNARGGG